MGCWGLDLLVFGSGKEAMPDFCENKNEPLVPISCRNSPDALSKYNFIFIVLICCFLSDQNKKAGYALCIAMKLQPTAHC